MSAVGDDTFKVIYKNFCSPQERVTLKDGSYKWYLNSNMAKKLAGSCEVPNMENAQTIYYNPSEIVNGGVHLYDQRYLGTFGSSGGNGTMLFLWIKNSCDDSNKAENAGLPYTVTAPTEAINEPIYLIFVGATARVLLNHGESFCSAMTSDPYGLYVSSTDSSSSNGLNVPPWSTYQYMIIAS